MTYTAEVLAPLFGAAAFMVFYWLIDRRDERELRKRLSLYEQRVNAEYMEAALEECARMFGSGR